MQKTLIKNSAPKTRVAQTDSNKNIRTGKRAKQTVTAAEKKAAGNLMQILNYQYQDSDLEQFVY